MSAEPTLTAQEVADVLRCSVFAVYRLRTRAHNPLRPMHIGRGFRYTHAEVERWQREETAAAVSEGQR